MYILLQYQLRRASLTEDDAFAFLKADIDGDYISYDGFCEALRQVGAISRFCNCTRTWGRLFYFPLV